MVHIKAGRVQMIKQAASSQMEHCLNPYFLGKKKARHYNETGVL
jgi:hypothetical protein